MAMKLSEMDGSDNMLDQDVFDVKHFSEENFEGTLATFTAFAPIDGANLSRMPEDYDYDMETSHNTFFWDELLPTLIVYCLTFVLGLVGNSLIIFTIFTYRKMKSTTNVFLASLASSDLLLILFCIPVKGFQRFITSNQARSRQKSENITQTSNETYRQMKTLLNSFLIKEDEEEEEEVLLNAPLEENFNFRSASDSTIPTEIPLFNFTKGFLPFQLASDKLSLLESNLKSDESNSDLELLMAKLSEEIRRCSHYIGMLKETERASLSAKLSVSDSKIELSKNAQRLIDSETPVSSRWIHDRMMFPVTLHEDKGRMYSLTDGWPEKNKTQIQFGVKKGTAKENKMHEKQKVDSLTRLRGKSDNLQRAESNTSLLSFAMTSTASKEMLKSNMPLNAISSIEVPKNNSPSKDTPCPRDPAKTKDLFCCDDCLLLKERIRKLEKELEKVEKRMPYYRVGYQTSTKTSSETMLKRLRSFTKMKYLDNQNKKCKARHSKRAVSAPETAVCRSTNRNLSLRSSNSDYQLHVGMEITMENVDPVTGQKLYPEVSEECQQEGNIQCKMFKDKDEPLLLMNTNFSYNPRTGMLFKDKKDASQAQRQSRDIIIPLRQSAKGPWFLTTRRNSIPAFECFQAGKNVLPEKQLAEETYAFGKGSRYSESGSGTEGTASLKSHSSEELEIQNKQSDKEKRGKRSESKEPAKKTSKFKKLLKCNLEPRKAEKDEAEDGKTNKGRTSLQKIDYGEAEPKKCNKDLIVLKKAEKSETDFKKSNKDVVELLKAETSEVDFKRLNKDVKELLKAQRSELDFKKLSSEAETSEVDLKRLNKDIKELLKAETSEIDFKKLNKDTVELKKPEKSEAEFKKLNKDIKELLKAEISEMDVVELKKPEISEAEFKKLNKEEAKLKKVEKCAAEPRKIEEDEAVSKKSGRDEVERKKIEQVEALLEIIQKSETDSKKMNKCEAVQKNMEEVEALLEIIEKSEKEPKNPGEEEIGKKNVEEVEALLEIIKKSETEPKKMSRGEVIHKNMKEVDALIKKTEKGEKEPLELDEVETFLEKLEKSETDSKKLNKGEIQPKKIEQVEALYEITDEKETESESSSKDDIELDQEEDDEEVFEVVQKIDTESKKLSTDEAKTKKVETLSEKTEKGETEPKKLVSGEVVSKKAVEGETKSKKKEKSEAQAKKLDKDKDKAESKKWGEGKGEPKKSDKDKAEQKKPDKGKKEPKAEKSKPELKKMDKSGGESKESKESSPDKKKKDKKMISRIPTRRKPTPSSPRLAEGPLSRKSSTLSLATSGGSSIAECFASSAASKITIKLAKLFSFTWTFGFFLCKLVHYMQNVSAICSVLTLTAMSLERYYAIVHPMKAQYICTISQARRIITRTWISAFLLAVPILFAQVHLRVGVKVEAYWCVRDWDNETIWRAHELYMMLIILVIPTGVMAVAYTAICWEIWEVMQRRHDMTCGKGHGISRQARLQKTSSFDSFPSSVYANSAARTDSKRSRGLLRKDPMDDAASVQQVIKMLVAVVVIYVICWGPMLIDNVLQAYGILSHIRIGWPKYMGTAFHLMAYFNSCINPIIYGFMSKNFRESFRKTLCCVGKKPETTYRSFSLSQTRTTSLRYAESSFGRTVSISLAV